MTTEVDKRAMGLYLSGKTRTLEQARAETQGGELGAIKESFRKAGINL